MSTYNLSTDLVDRVVRTGGGDREAIRADGVPTAYRELQELIGRVGNGLRSLGVRPRDRVLLVLADSLEFAAVYLGAIRIGAVSVPCNPAVRRTDLELFLRESEAPVVVVGKGACTELAVAIADVRHSPTVISVGGARPDTTEWEAWAARSDPECEPAPTSPDDPAFWLWTSGSTGHPRPAVHRHCDWRPCVEGYAKGVLGIGPDDVCFSAAKAFHAYGLGNGTVFPLAVGARTVYFEGRPTPEAIFAILGAERPSLFFGVPTMYAALLAFAERNPAPDLSCLRYCVSAGEPLPGEFYRRWRARFGVEILDGIGSTEVLHIYLSARPGRVRPGSTGTPVEGYSVRVVDEEGNDVSPGRLGDLWVRAPSLACGYSGRSDLRPLRMHGDWFVTGDKFYRDADGFHWYVGRADDMFKSRAEWVSPIAVESALIEHPAVLEAAVVGRTAPDGLSFPRAFVVVKPGVVASEALGQELQSWVRDRSPPSDVPRWVEFLPELPKSTTGKLLRYQLRNR